MIRRVTQADPPRYARQAVTVVGGCYAALGLIVAVAAGIRGDQLGALFGFLVMSGALAFSAVLRAVLQIETCLRALAEGVGGIRRRSDEVERRLASLQEQLTILPPSSNGHEVRILDLTAVGTGDPSVLTAATLDRHGYPRLVTNLDEGAPPEGPPEASPRSDQSLPSQTKANAALAAPPESLLAQWRVAMSNGDLAGCRSIYAALAKATSGEELAALTAQLETLAQRIERTLREAFADRVRQGDFRAALAVGERMCHLLPDRPVCTEFRRLEPHLARRVRAGAAPATPAIST